MKVIALALASLVLAGCARVAVGDGDADAAEESLEVLGASMEPTLHCARPAVGCRAPREDEVVIRDEARIERREIVAFEVGPRARRLCGSGGLFVKRVVGVAGDRIRFVDGAVSLNGRRLREPYANKPTDPGEAGSDVVVPPRHVFVLGDNRAQSCDSRVWGPLSLRRIVGVGVAVQRGERRVPLP